MSSTSRCPPVSATLASSWIFLYMRHSGSSAFTEQLARLPHTGVRIRVAAYEPLSQNKTLLKNPDLAVKWTDDLFKQAQLHNAAAPQGGRATVGFKTDAGLLLKRKEGYQEVARRHGTRIIWYEDDNSVRDALKLEVDQVIVCKVQAARTKGASAELCETGSSKQTYLTDPNHLQFAVKGSMSEKKITQADVQAVLPVRIHNSSFPNMARVVRGHLKAREAMEAAARLLAPSMSEVLHITYQQFLDHGDETVARAQAFLGADPCPDHLPATRASSMSKPLGAFVRPTGDTPICKIITNWDEVCLALGNCKGLGLPGSLDYIDAGCHCEHVSCSVE